MDGTWNGFCTSQSFFETFDLAKDARSDMWLYGPQYDAAGQPLMLGSKQLDYTPHVTSLYDAANPTLANEGVRFAKYEYENGLNGECMSNDYVVYRYADILMMKGEALVRMGRAGDAVPLFNEVRQRTGLPDYVAADLTLDEIYAERGREFVWEGSRRQDMIRFGKWTAARDFKAAEVDNHTELFPIPARVMTNNEKLVQNDGYTN
ncbi:MAG: RagB/SusD family nutrient uptake outer membrane protein [Bacteroides sp.]|nr:RagB/SusD family nutrient uptake outer membrane protein [Bacteroides sp.]